MMSFGIFLSLVTMTTYLASTCRIDTMFNTFTFLAGSFPSVAVVFFASLLTNQTQVFFLPPEN